MTDGARHRNEACWFPSGPDRNSDLVQVRRVEVANLRLEFPLLVPRISLPVILDGIPNSCGILCEQRLAALSPFRFQFGFADGSE